MKKRPRFTPWYQHLEEGARHKQKVDLFREVTSYLRNSNQEIKILSIGTSESCNDIWALMLGDNDVITSVQVCHCHVSTTPNA